MHLYNVGMGIWQYIYTFHITNFAKVSSGEMILHGQKVLGIMCAHGLCLVLSSFCTVSPVEHYCTTRLKTRKFLGFFFFSMEGPALWALLSSMTTTEEEYSQKGGEKNPKPNICGV